LVTVKVVGFQPEVLITTTDYFEEEICVGFWEKKIAKILVC
jgi:hypothetical protein